VSARAQFVRMQDSTAADWQVIAREFMPFAQALPERVVKHLQLLQGDYGGFPVDRYTHSLQTATRALRAGRDDEYVVCALLHDIGDTLGAFNHPHIKDHPHYAQTEEFCAEYDNPAFDPKAETLPIEDFMPLLRRVMAQPRHSIYLRKEAAQ
jgi:predicted HD phosphohydrolase